MTDEDRDLLAVLVRMKDASFKFGLCCHGTQPVSKAQAEMMLMIFDMADRVLKRMIYNPVVVEGDSL